MITSIPPMIGRFRQDATTPLLKQPPAPGLSSPDYLQARAAESGGNYDPLVLPGSDSPAYYLTNGTGAVKPGATTSPLGRHMTAGATRRL